VADVDDNFVKIEISENIFIQVQRHNIENMMPKGTFKTLHKKVTTTPTLIKNVT
jgi:preprotein translocase subunit YajC